jgi:antitoxin (DNA-binding transcriptional repressor) of toxin-antitoxin stability system
MKKTNVRDLHLNTSAIISEASKGEVFVIEKRGVAVAELRPLRPLPPGRRLPNREGLISKSRRVRSDSGRLLEEDRS